MIQHKTTSKHIILDGSYTQQFEYKINDLIVGHVYVEQMEVSEESILIIRNLFVQHEYRNMGIANALNKEIIKEFPKSILMCYIGKHQYPVMKKVMKANNFRCTGKIINKYKELVRLYIRNPSS